MPQLLIPLINEVFHTSYSEEEPFEQLRNEHYEKFGTVVTVSYTHLDVYKRQPLYCSTGWSKICFSPSLALHFLDKHSISDFSVPVPAHADADPHREMHLLPGLFQMHNHFPAESH